MKRITIILMALCFVLSANAFATTAGKHKHKHHAKPAVAAPADATPAAPAETPAK